MSSWKSARKRKHRNIWKRRGRIYIVFNRGIYMTIDMGEHGNILVPINGREQPGAYLKYPHP